MTRDRVIAKRIAAMLVVFAVVVCVACGSSSNNSSSTSSVQGTWTIAMKDSQGATSTLQVALVSSACSVSTPMGELGVSGPNCFVADNATTGLGTVSGTGFMYPPQFIMLGIPTLGSPAYPSPAVNLFLVESTDASGDANAIAMYSGSGTLSAGVSGTWTCTSEYNPPSNSCPLSGTFSGSKN